MERKKNQKIYRTKNIIDKILKKLKKIGKEDRYAKKFSFEKCEKINKNLHRCNATYECV